LIKNSLSASRIAIAVASDALIDIIVVDLGIEHGFDASFKSEFGVIDFATGFDEFGHAYAEDVDGGAGFGRHFGLIALKLKGE
jgi:hypothetical protein